MILSTQSQVLRAIKARLMVQLNLPESRVFVTSDPNMAEALDFAVQVSPLAAGAVSDMNRVGLGFITERIGITTMVRSASDQANKQNRRITGADHGVLFRQDSVRQALIQHGLGGLLQIDLRFVASGSVRPHPRTEGYVMATDTFVCSYAYPHPTGSVFRYGFFATTPTYADLTEEAGYTTAPLLSVIFVRSPVVATYAWFFIASAITPTFYEGVVLRVFTNQGSEVVDGVTYTKWRSPTQYTQTTVNLRIA